ncbi:MAG: hypothetical protein N4A44_04195 [Alphaproteobacteria bacterium]|jgi:hypothetical protein|nr:hypothetical protein [Alphaproteobacteria bacterium]
MSKERFKTASSAYVILVKDDKVGFPKGDKGFLLSNIEGGETAREAVVRKVEDSLKINVSVDNLYEPLTMHRSGKNGESFDLFFVCDKWDGNISNVDWYNFDKLPKDMIEFQLLALQSLMSGVKYLEYGWKK